MKNLFYTAILCNIVLHSFSQEMVVASVLERYYYDEERGYLVKTVRNGYDKGYDDIHVTEYSYLADYEEQNIAAVPALRQKRLFALPIETVSYSRMGSDTLSADYNLVQSGKLNLYSPQGYLSQEYAFRNAFPISQFQGLSRELTNAVPTTDKIIMDDRYTLLTTVDSVDQHGRSLQVTDALTGVTTSYLYDTNHYPVATVINAKLEDIAYTSFENGFAHNLTYQGHVNSKWDNASYLTIGFEYLDTGYIQISDLSPDKTYVLSIHSSNGVLFEPQLDSGAQVTRKIRQLDFSFMFGMIVNAPILYYEITGTSSIHVTGGSMDEIRLVPKGAIITTQSKGWGESCVVDANGIPRYIYYSYDELIGGYNYNQTKQYSIHRNLKNTQ